MSKHSFPGRAAWLAGAAAILPVAALNSASPVAAAPAAGQFEPPLEPMVLTRILRRPLPGGAEVRTLRSYEIRFVPDGNGFRIDGTLLDAHIDVPSPYEALAAIERARPDEGLFPLRLDVAGRLIASRDPRPSDSDRKASAAALKRVGMFSLPDGESRQAKAFIGQFESQSARTAWLEDLFRPQDGRWRHTHTIPMPNGTRGHVSVDIEASTAGSAGLLSSLDRTVVTDIDGDARITYESWTLTRIP